MSNKTHIILIHGTWCTGKSWGKFVPALEALGLQVHTPTLRYHDLPMDEGAEKVATVSLTDYVDDLSQLLLSLDSPAIILGHSLGGLIAQLLAARHPDKQKGLVLLGPAPMAGIFALYPTMLATFYQHYLQWGFWKKPLYPTKKRVFDYCMNHQPDDLREEFSRGLVAESGRVYAELAFWFLDPNQASKVNTAVLQETPILVVTGTDDKIVVSNVPKATAKKYKRSTYVELQGSDHMYEMGAFMPKTVALIQDWMQKNRLE